MTIWTRNNLPKAAWENYRNRVANRRAKKVDRRQPVIVLPPAMGKTTLDHWSKHIDPDVAFQWVKAVWDAKRP